MATDDSILHMFCLVDDRLPNIPKHPQAEVYPSEVVTIGILFARNGGFVRACSRWLKRYDGDWFGDGTLPERTRFQRLLKTHHDWCDLLLADPTFFTVIDSYPIDRLVPIRHGRSPHQLGNKGRDKGRWRVRIKVCWLLNDCCRVVAWDWDTMNVHDKRFNSLVEQCVGTTMVLADDGCRDQNDVPENMKVCKNGTWNERMCVATAWSMVSVIGDVRRIRHRVAASIQARLAVVAAMVTVLMDLFPMLHPDADPHKMSIAEFSL